MITRINKETCIRTETCESSEYFRQMSSKSILIISNYPTVSKLVHFFLRHSVGLYSKQIEVSCRFVNIYTFTSSVFRINSGYCKCQIEIQNGITLLLSIVKIQYARNNCQCMQQFSSVASVLGVSPLVRSSPATDQRLSANVKHTSIKLYNKNVRSNCDQHAIT